MKCFQISITVKTDSRGFCFAVMESSYKNQINGFIQRIADDEFFIEAEGADENLSKFISWFESRLQWTKLLTKTVKESELKGYVSFDIRDTRNTSNTQKQHHGHRRHDDLAARFGNNISKNH